jgi:hypothetical protein
LSAGVIALKIMKKWEKKILAGFIENAKKSTDPVEIALGKVSWAELHTKKQSKKELYNPLAEEAIITPDGFEATLDTNYAKQKHTNNSRVLINKTSTELLSEGPYLVLRMPLEASIDKKIKFLGG